MVRGVVKFEDGFNKKWCQTGTRYLLIFLLGDSTVEDQTQATYLGLPVDVLLFWSLHLRD